jgi:hypothetical protein
MGGVVRGAIAASQADGAEAISGRPGESASGTAAGQRKWMARGGRSGSKLADEGHRGRTAQGRAARRAGRCEGSVRRPTRRLTEGREARFLSLIECGSRPRSTQALDVHDAMYR